MAEIYHILSRGVDKRKIFLDDRDYFRFVHNLFEFNDQKNANSNFYFFQKASKSHDLRSREIKRKPRKLIVEIHAFCLMPNHYHLLLSPKTEGGITQFMRKLNIGYAKYFNERNKRTGALFEGRFKSILVKDQAHFIHLPYYIHCNPLDLIAPEWRERKINNLKEAIGFLENYRWSSYLDYIGKRNLPSVTQRDFLLDFFKSPKKYKKETKSWLKELNTNNLRKITLE